jgi:phosphoglycolate phosphatase-like HAD superfamily hydrolase
MLRFDCWCFDLDGTLIDIEPRFTTIYQQLVGNLSGTILPDYFAKRRSGLSEIDICGISGLRPGQLGEYDAMREQMLEDVDFLGLDTVFPGAYRLLDYLSSLSVKKWIITHRCNLETTEHQLDRLGLSSRVDGWVCTKIASPHHTERKKTLAMSPLGKMAAVSAKADVLSRFAANYSTVMVCDDLTDIFAARQAGVVSLAVSTGLIGPQVLAQSKPDYLFETLESLVAHLVGSQD